MTDSEDLINWKTQAWADPKMVSWYSGRMTENSGTNRLKNRIEVDLCVNNVIGPKIIDVGIGTGRASLPLARLGYSVTGIDSSQAMLDESRRLAGDLPIALDLGDVQKLPIGNAEFDSLISLNCLMHFPHWRDILAEWTRVVREDGRMVFDVHSLDHYRLAHGAGAGEGETLKTGISSYQLMVASGDLLAAADELGLSVVDIVPYGAFLGGGNRNHLLAIEAKNWWRRLLTWLATDDRMLEFARFLEQELVGRLTTLVTGRYMVILDKRHDRQRNQAWLAGKAQLNRRLGSEFGLEALAPELRLSPAEFKSRLDAHLRASLRNFRLFEGLCQALLQAGARVDLASFLEQDMLLRLQDWQRRRRYDQEAVLMARELIGGPAVADAMRLGGTDLGNALEYFLIEDLLTKYHGLFSGIRS